MMEEAGKADADRSAGGADAAEHAVKGAPYPDRHDGWTIRRRQDFLARLEACGNIRDACRAVGMSNTVAYRLRRNDRIFAAAWDKALAGAARSLEAVAWQRAVEGVEEPVFSGGRQVGTRRKPSDSLLRMLLQGADPEKYGRAGGPHPVRLREELEARVDRIEKAAYDRAWRAFEAEYRYRIEPDYVSRSNLEMLARMHGRMCGNAHCAECHPERQEQAEQIMRYGTWVNTLPDPDHRPIPPFAEWLGTAEEKHERAIELWRAEHHGEMTARRIAANRAGTECDYDERQGEPYQEFRTALEAEQGWEIVSWSDRAPPSREEAIAAQERVLREVLGDAFFAD